MHAFQRENLKAVEQQLRQEDQLIAEKDAAYRRKDWQAFWSAKRELEALTSPKPAQILHRVA